MHKLAAESELCNRVFGYRTRMIEAGTLRRDWLDENGAQGALHEPLGIGNPPRQVRVSATCGRRGRAGARIHVASPVREIVRDGAHVRVSTPQGRRARPRGRGRHRRLHRPGRASRAARPGHADPVQFGRHPVLAPDEVEAAGLRTRQVVTDSRILRHYYRLLPDDRVQIGSRSAITGRDAGHPRHLATLLAGLHAKFPTLRTVGIEHSWWGWVDVSHDMMPRIVRPDPAVPLFYAIGYGGNGVSYSAQAGRRLAQLVAGRPVPTDLRSSATSCRATSSPRSGASASGCSTATMISRMRPPEAGGVARPDRDGERRRAIALEEKARALPWTRWGRGPQTPIRKKMVRVWTYSPDESGSGAVVRSTLSRGRPQRGPPTSQSAVQPPSTTRLVPVTRAEASEARNSTAPSGPRPCPGGRA